MTKYRKRLVGAASFGFLVLLMAGPMPVAGAQTEPTVLGTLAAQADPVPPTTSPCVGCGPSGSTVPGANRAYAWTDHYCLPDGTSAFSLTYGMGKNVGVFPATFYATYSNGPQPDRVLGKLNPGQQNTVYPLVIVGPGETMRLTVVARLGASGETVPFGNGEDRKSFVLTCPCEQPATTTTVPPSSTVPPTVTTPPGTPTTPPVVTSVPGGSTPPTVASGGGSATTTTPFELPATGPSGNVLFAAAVILGIGAFLLFATRGLRDDLDDL